MAVFDINAPTIATGTIINLTYTGKEQYVSLPPGNYKIECWGANGGNGNSSNTNYSGGIGGYSVGFYTISDSTKVYCYIGGRGVNGSSTGVYSGGYNGGGKGRCYCGSGGGATHIALSSGKLSALSKKIANILIVAGGGGGGGYYNSSYYSKGGNGGGTNGANAVSSYTRYSGKGGTQSEGGSAYESGYEGSFGQGGNCMTSTSSFYRSASYGAGGGGGGFYGGGNGYRECGGGGGGSGYISSLLTESSTTIESTSTNPDTDGNGYCRITVISVDSEGSGLNSQIFYTGDIINCGYSGSIKSITLNRGSYLLECWGANGESYSSDSGIGGEGGYSAGILNTEKNITLYIGVGGLPYNGGGATGERIKMGGGATHIATASGLLSTLESNQSSILIVAGGGGGGACYDPAIGSDTYYDGGCGGGLTGFDGDGDDSYFGQSGTQTAGGEAYETDQKGSFGQGGTAYNDTSRHTAGGGGGGFYGGGGGYVTSSLFGAYMGSGGGGSGYLNPILTNSLTEGRLITTTTKENGSITTSTTNNPNFVSNPDSDKLGFCRITVLKSLPTCVKVNEEWRKVQQVYCKLNNKWRSHTQPVSVALSGNYRVSYNLGDEFSLNNLIVTATYADGTSSILTEYTSSIVNGTILDKPGQQTVIIYNGGMFTGFNINVVAPIELELSGDYKTEYIINDTFTIDNLTIELKYSDNSLEEVDYSKCTFSIEEGTVFTKAETKNVIITYDEKLTTSYPITIKTPTDLSFSGSYKTLYNITESVNIDNLITTLIYDDETTEIINNVTVNPVVGTVYSTNGTKTINISYIKNNISVNRNYHVYVRKPVEVSLTGQKTSFYTDETFNYDDLVVTLIYDNGDTETIDNYTISRASGSSFTTTGTETITITVVKWGITVTATYDITIISPEPVVITGTGDSTYCYASINGTTYTSATTVPCHVGDVVALHVASSATLSCTASINIDGTSSSTSISTTEVNENYTVASGGCSIALTYSSKKVLFKTRYYGTILLTTTNT